jgi:glutamate/tyrosine decarboxylase-like PLP-dependent enzyme
MDLPDTATRTDLEEVSVPDLLGLAAAHACEYLATLDQRSVATTASPSALRARLSRPLPVTPTASDEVINDLIEDTAGGILGSTSGRFFGWVTGGTLPAALAADWLTSAWDQNGASNLTAPAEAIIEEICGEWAKQLLGIPATASFAFVTGSQMAHMTAFAAARHKLLAERDWNVEERGLAGAPLFRILTTENRHDSIIRAARYLGLGTNAVTCLATDQLGRMDIAALDEALQKSAKPTIVSLQAGDLNTGIFDLFAPLCRVAHRHGAWVHVDGAFGLWAATSAKYRHLLAGADQADSWATDGHKWLNLPFDSGLVFVADEAAHRAAFQQQTSYSVPTDNVRNQKDWNPEWSRRGRGFAAYAAIRALGRSGIAAMIERCCAHADRLVTGIGALPATEIIARPIINQGLVRFLSPDGDHDRRTDNVIRLIQAKGVAWFGGVTWRGMRAMRVSVCNWKTTDRDIAMTLASIAEVVASMPQ